MDKFALVYEFNKESPLITYQASKEMEIQNYSKALSLLNSAIELYPYHATPYFLRALALAYNKKYDEAIKSAEYGNNILKAESTFNYYKEQIEKIKREAEGIVFDFDDTVNDVLDEEFLEPDDFDPLSDLDLINDDVEESKPRDKYSHEETAIVTETLAEIYASQSNYEEAIEIYEKLRDQKPELSQKFNNRIAELNQAIENKKQRKFGK